MASILSKTTIGTVLIILVASDPSAAGGTSSPIGSLALLTNGAGQWTKVGAADTAWSSNITGVTEVTIDITGLTSIDLTGYTGNVIVNLTTTDPVNTINKIINATNIANITFRPATGKDGITFNDKSIGGAGANIHLYAPSLLPLGTLSGFLTVQFRNAEWYEVNFIDQYAS